VNGPDVAWMLVSTALVLLMTPALAFFYGGLVRSKNALNTMMMSVAALGFVGVAWAALGYSLAFAEGTPVVGGVSRALLAGVGLEAQGTIPHLLFMAYQGTFAIITAALVSGAIVERMRFAPYLAFITLWSLVVYAPVAHWVWGGGFLATLGALDFAGGTVVHVNAAAAALVAAVVIGRRKDYARQAILPHNVPFTLLGAGLLWFGWFGFNAGSALAANAIAALAFVNTLLAPAGTLVVWTVLDLTRSRKVTAVGAATAIVVGLVAVTPAAGFIGPMPALVLGMLAAFPSYFALLYRARRHRRCPPDGRSRLEGLERDGRRPAPREPGAARHPGARRRGCRGVQRGHDLRAAEAHRPRRPPEGREPGGRPRSRRQPARRGGLRGRRGRDPHPAALERRDAVRSASPGRGDGRRPLVKLVVAIVRPEKANEVLEALFRSDVQGVTLSRVQGHGGETEQVETYRGTTVKMELQEKVRFDIGVSDHFVEPTVKAILGAARTGDVGDGKVFVLPVEKIYRIRTGEEDRAAVTPVQVAAAGRA
jgi:ammonium transporter